MGKDSGQVTRDEHDETINAKRVSLVSAVTVNAVVNTSAGGGNTTVAQGTSPWVSSLKGSVTIDSQPAWIDPKTFIGLATVVPSFGSNVTVHTWVGSASGLATVFVAPASNRFWLKSLHVASLGSSEVEIKSGATTLIPLTSLATQGGYFEHYGSPGLPSRAQADGFVVSLKSTATVSVMANWYPAP